STIVEVAGVKVGIVGVTTESTPRTTISSNFAGLAMAPLAATIASEAAALRAAGATVVVVAAHAGGDCKKLDDPHDLSSCDDGEICRALRDVPAGAVDVVVGGHTHQGVAHEVNGVAVIQSYAEGRAFGRVDLQIDATGHVTGHTIFPPRDLCRDRKRGAPC